MEYVCRLSNAFLKHSMKLVLGSESPRRKELLTTLGYSFRTLKPNADETIPDDLKIEQVPTYLAELKSSLLINQINSDEILICADTIVVLDNQIIGKPSDFEHAKKILESLSNRTHIVFTGVNIQCHNKSHSFLTKTEVTFTELRVDQIEYYIRTFSPFDKAGSYGIQDWIGATAVLNINGSYTNVMGLPTAQLNLELAKF
jgi:septum formation protein